MTDALYMIVGFVVLHSVFGIIGTEMAKSKHRDSLEGFIVGFCFSVLGLFFYSRIAPIDPNLNQASKEDLERNNKITMKNTKLAGITMMSFLVFILMLVLMYNK